MIGILLALIRLLSSLFPDRRELVLENLALRQQLSVLRRSVKKPRLRKADRVFWIGLSRYWTGWCKALIIVQPKTVVAWHRWGFHRYWN
ncbi:hypothetical protein MYX82_13415 [Acidobacteria bacterium AH-259-D05]|nr:hypothetical protein [Acidobacteria bacterium AH-259-D05]